MDGRGVDTRSDIMGPSPKDNVTLRLEGRVHLDDFAKAMAQWRKLCRSLTQTYAKGVGVTWVLDGLSKSSAVSTIRGFTHDAAQRRRLEPVIEEYARVGRSLREGTIQRYHPSIAAPALALGELVNGHIKAVIFQTPETDEEYRGGVSVSETSITRDFGAIEGAVEVLSRRGQLHFTIYDSIHNRAVLCYLRQEMEPVMREIWGHRAIVEGMISREADTGRPVAIREISDIQRMPQQGPDGYRDARGATSSLRSNMTWDEAMRKVRYG